MDKKGILDAIIACRTATTKEQYFEKRASLFCLAEKVYVKPGRIKNAVLFTQYFLSNWDSVAPMWVYAYRKRMPLQASDLPIKNFTLSALQGCGSTQACESFFRVMKQYEKQAFGQRSPSLHEMIPYISMAIDKRFLLRKILVGNKRMRYFHKELEFHKALDQE